jgi:hypothetical protein
MTTPTPIDAWPPGPDGLPLDATDCPGCGRDGCEDPAHRTTLRKPNGKAGKCAHVLDAQAACSACGLQFGLPVESLHDAAEVAAQGRTIAATGVPMVVDGVIPDYGMLGMLVAYAKVGKTTFGQALGAAVARGGDFIGRSTQQRRVLAIAAEDPPEYTAYTARHLDVAVGAMTFYRAPVVLNDDGLARIAATVKAGGYGLVLIASWQAVVRGLVRDENDNAGAVVCVERVKAATRETKVPWLIDAHSGRNEDQADDADPIRALRGASAAAASADYLLSLRYADGAFGTRRRLSGRGRFVNLAPVTINYDIPTGTYELVGATKDAGRETTWRLIAETGAVTAEPRSVDAIARAAGLVDQGGKLPGFIRRRTADALHGREGVTKTEGVYRGRRTVLYSHAGTETE